MSIRLSRIDYTTDNFIDFISKTNAVLDELEARIVTTESNTTVGTASITGAVATNTVYVSDIYGGAINAPDTLTVHTPTVLANTLTVTGAVQTSNTVNVTGATTLANTLTVVGNTTMSNVAANNANLSNTTINSLTVNTVRGSGSNITINTNVALSQSMVITQNLQVNTARILDNITVPFINTQRIGGIGPGAEVAASSNTNFAEHVRIDKTLTVGTSRFTNQSDALVVDIPSRTIRMSNTQTFYGEQTGATTTPFLVFSTPKTILRSAKIHMHARSATANSTTAWETLLVCANNDVSMTEYAIVTVGNTQTGTLSANTTATDVRVFFHPANTNNTVGYSVHTIS